MYLPTPIEHLIFQQKSPCFCWRSWDQVTTTMEALVNLAYKNAKNSFTLPGLGKRVLVNRKARIGRNPATGEQVKIATKRVVKFRVAKAAK